MPVTAANIIGGNGNRRKNDFYPTPKECTEALIREEHEHLNRSRFGLIWEPACGEGHIAKVFSDHDWPSITTDKYETGFGKSGIDFLETQERRAKALITNPPFSLAADFITHAFDLKLEYLALLFKSTFWHARKRTALFNKYPPSVIYAMNWRPDFDGRGSPTMDCIWTVWDIRRFGQKRFEILAR